jgi:gluconolactonase
VVVVPPHRDVTTPRTLRAAAAVAGLAGVLGGLAFACAETGPGAPRRTNGCINQECPPVDLNPVAPTPGGDGGASAFGDPLAGTSKRATLVRGRFRFTEGPLWIGGRLLFTDVPANLVYEMAADGGVSQFKGNSGGANGLAIDQNGGLVACEGGRKRVTRGSATRGSQLDPVAETHGGEPLNSPNDVVVRADGNIYFTDPNYSGDPNTQDDEAVYRIDPAGKLSRVLFDFSKPNGIALSADETTLYVVDNGAGALFAATLDASGGPGRFTEIAKVPGGDGMAVDAANNLYVAATAGVEVFGSSGKKLGTIVVDATPSNCTFGGPQLRTLFITANAGETDPRTGLYSIVLNVPGRP